MKAVVKQPRIYVYTEPQYEPQGILKVGYTSTGNVDKRIREQFPIAKPGASPYRTLLDVPAIDDQGNPFTDKKVHAYLKLSGVPCLKRADGHDTEYFQCPLATVEHAIAEIKAGHRFEPTRYLTYPMRPEQCQAVEQTSGYFLSHPREQADSLPPKFLWNAKMRFGKTFTAFQLAKQMKWTRMVVLTYKPAVEDEWRRELLDHVDFEGWQFVSRDGLAFEDADPSKPICWFISFQDILGVDRQTGEGKARFEVAHSVDWDCVVLDEYHFGAHREGAKAIYELASVDDDLNRAVDPEDREAEEAEASITPPVGIVPLQTKTLLYLSGTPFQALQSGEFLEEQIFTWSYIDEQRAKESWQGDLGSNPYAELPQMKLVTYELSPALRAVAEQGENNEFSLNEFFRATPSNKDRTASFVHEAEVQHFLEFISGRHVVNRFSEDGRKIETSAPLAPKGGATHSLWFLPNIAACRAMKELLDRQQNAALFSGHKAVLAAGPEAGMGVRAKDPVVEAIGDGVSGRTITLSCMKLTTGVTVKQWSAVLILRDIASPETYFQTAFRCQSPWAETGFDPKNPTARKILKSSCLVYDFSPQRALNLVFEYCSINNRENRRLGDVLSEFEHLLPIYAYADGLLQRLKADDIWNFAAVGTGKTMLARRWQSLLLVIVTKETITKLQANPELIDAVQGLEQFRAYKASIGETLSHIIAEEERLAKPKREGREPTAKESEEDKSLRKEKQALREALVRFLTRVPHFMYLTDFREESLTDVIRELDSELFERVTGMKVVDFDKLVQIGLFNKALITQAILAFRRFEEPSLNYMGGGRILKKIGTFDASVSPEESDEVLGIPKRVRYAIKPISSDRLGRSARQIVAALLPSRTFSFRGSEKLLHRYEAGTKLCLYEKGSGIFAWIELDGPVGPGKMAKKALADPDLFLFDAPIRDSGWVDPPVVIDVALRSQLDWIVGKNKTRWAALVRTATVINEHDYLLLTRQSVDERNLPAE